MLRGQHICFVLLECGGARLRCYHSGLRPGLPPTATVPDHLCLVHLVITVTGHGSQAKLENKTTFYFGDGGHVNTIKRLDVLGAACYHPPQAIFGK
jgi:hypothetical protein